MCVAHRNRIKILERLLAEEVERVTTEEQRVFTVLTVACGPAVEIQRFIRTNELAGQCALHLMDFNAETLAYTKERVQQAMEASGRKPTVKFIQKSIDDLLKNIHLESEGFLPSYDMIYCAGLFDYFPDNVCRNLLLLYHRWVRPGGCLPRRTCIRTTPSARSWSICSTGISFTGTRRTLPRSRPRTPTRRSLPTRPDSTCS